MNNNNNSNAGKDIASEAGPSSLADRQSFGKQVPFFLRAWYLKDFPEYKEVAWLQAPQPVALWSNYSDPICDLGDIDVFDES